MDVLEQQITARPGLAAHSVQLAALRSLSFPHKLSDERGLDEDAPHLELIDQIVANMREAYKALDKSRPDFAKADGFFEEAGRVLRQIEELRA